MPRVRYIDGEWYLNRSVRANLTFEVGGSHYSVPERYVGQKVNTKVTSTTVFVYHENRQIAVHERSLKDGTVSILDHHRPATHQYMVKAQLKQCVETVSHIGPHCMEFMEILHAAYHRSPKSRERAWEIVQLADDLGVEVVEDGASIAKRIKPISIGKLREISNALARRTKTSSDLLNEDIPPPSDNVRGAQYFETKRKGEV